MDEDMKKYIALADFWYRTDFPTFKLQHDGIEDAINHAKDCIENQLESTIDIIKQDIDEIEDPEFTREANKIIEVIMEGRD